VRQRNAGGQLGVDVDGEEVVPSLRPFDGADHQSAVDLEIRRLELEVDVAVEALDLLPRQRAVELVERNLALELEDIGDLERDASAVQGELRNPPVLVPGDPQPFDRGA